MSARTIKSSETEESPASILVIHDWLDFMRCEKSIRENLRFMRAPFLTYQRKFQRDELCFFLA